MNRTLHLCLIKLIFSEYESPISALKAEKAKVSSDSTAEKDRLVGQIKGLEEQLGALKAASAVAVQQEPAGQAAEAVGQPKTFKLDPNAAEFVPSVHESECSDDSHKTVMGKTGENVPNGHKY
jgi:hypothetical protein